MNNLVRVNKSDAPQNMPFFPTDQRPNSRGQSAQRDLACDVHDDQYERVGSGRQAGSQTGLIGNKSESVHKFVGECDEKGLL